MCVRDVTFKIKVTQSLSSCFDVFRYVSALVNILTFSVRFTMTSRNEDGFLQWSRQNKELFRVFVHEGNFKCFCLFIDPPLFIAQDLGVEISQDVVAKLSIRLWESLPESERDRFRNTTPLPAAPKSHNSERIVFASSKDGKVLYSNHNAFAN